MPARIVKDFSTPPGTPSTRVEYMPPPERREHRRRPGGMIYDAATGRLRAAPLSVSPSLYVGLDLGQAADWSALAVVQPVATGYDVIDLQRVRERPYTEIVRDVADYLARPRLAGASALVIDATGVGRPVLDILYASGLDPIALTITGGARVTGNRRRPHVPKRDLVNGLLLAFQGGGLRIAAGLPHAATLTRELAEMRRKVSVAGHDSYGVWRDGEHDDLVLALSIALWCAERRRGRVRPSSPVTPPAASPPAEDVGPSQRRLPLDAALRW